MIRRGSWTELALGIAAVFAAGAIVDVAVGDAAPDVSGPQPSPRFRARAVFCPPAPPGATTTITALAPSRTTLPVGIEPSGPTPAELQASRILEHRVPDGRAREVVAYGGEIAATVTAASDNRGGGAAQCSPVSSPEWYFGEGSSALGFDERLLIFNPFPDEAVVGVTFFTPDGPETKANLRDVAVPAGESTVIAVNEFILRPHDPRPLAASVVAVRGRVVAWRALTVTSENRPGGMQLSLGAPAASTDWYFPDGTLGGTGDARLTVLNPNPDEEAVVTVSLPTGSNPLQPPKLQQVAIPPATVRAFALEDAAGRRGAEATGAGSVVRSDNGVPVVAERTITHEAGVTSEVGATVPTTGAVLGPPLVGATTDTLYLLNPGASAAHVTVSVHYAETRPATPDALSDVRVRAGALVAIPIAELTGGRAAVALVVSDRPIVAERAGTSSSDVGAVMGVPVSPR